MIEAVAEGSVSKFVEVDGSQMHYLERGEGAPILFLHGNPTSSYLWRNVLPHVAPHGRCIAVDLIGMGRSDKPDIDYFFSDHAAYVAGFIEALGLEDVILVLHDWGAGLGLDYAAQHEDNVRAIAFMEGVYRTFKWIERPFMERFMFKRMRHPKKGYKMIVEKNMFVERMLPMMIARKLSEAEMDEYRKPFLTKEHRKPLLMWPREIPFDGEPLAVHRRIEVANNWLQAAKIPKLLLWAKPGMIIRKNDLNWIRTNVTQLTDLCIGKGKHFIQEDQPDAVGSAIAQWIEKSL